MFHALADPRRREILRLVRDQPLSVNEIAEQFDITQQAISQHLKVLKDVGLVVDRREGTKRLYQVDPAGLGILRSYLDGFWERALTAFAQATEEHDDPDD